MNIENIEEKYNVHICEEQTQISHKCLGFVAYDIENNKKICEGKTLNRLIANLRRTKRD